MALAESIPAIMPAGLQKSRGSSCRGSPVRGSRNASPPGFSGAEIFGDRKCWPTSAALVAGHMAGPLMDAGKSGFRRAFAER
jgi:hypothetical protein